MQNRLHMPIRILTLSIVQTYWMIIPLVRDILADGSQPKVSIQDRKLFIDVGGGKIPSKLATSSKSCTRSDRRNYRSLRFAGRC